jgi:hypothetical protein
MTILALILYCISGAFSWVIFGALLGKIDPGLTVLLFSLLIINFITRQIILLGGKNEK